MKKLSIIYIFLSFLVFGSLETRGECVGKMINPISDICWKCLFPLRIAGVEVVSNKKVGDKDKVSRTICWCVRPPFGELPGIPISFWEPVRLIDITREPYCMVSLGGKKFSNVSMKGRGHVELDTDTNQKNSFYHAHWYIYPVIYWLELLMDFICLDTSSIDVAYLTELDPLWNDDKKAFIINPEAALFGNQIAQIACAADCAASSVSNTSLVNDALFWCNGCQGGLYPFTGTVNDHTGGVQASLLIAGKFMAKLHREGLLWGTTGIESLCIKNPMPIMRKSQYRFQMTYPVVDTKSCHGFGQTEVTWQPLKEYPYKGEDFAYLIWRKRDCCLL